MSDIGASASSTNGRPNGNGNGKQNGKFQRPLISQEEKSERKRRRAVEFELNKQESFRRIAERNAAMLPAPHCADN